MPSIAALKSLDSKKTVVRSKSGQDVKDNILLYLNTIFATKPIRLSEPQTGFYIKQKKPLKKHLAGARRPAKVLRRKEKREKRIKWLVKKLRKERKRKFSMVSKGWKEGPATSFSIPLFRKGKHTHNYYSRRAAQLWKTKCLNNSNIASALNGFKAFFLTIQPVSFKPSYHLFGAHSGIVHKNNKYLKYFQNIAVLDERRTVGFKRGYLWIKMKYHKVKHARMKYTTQDTTFKSLLRDKVWLTRLTRKENVRQRDRISFLKLRGRKHIGERRKSFRSDRKVVTTGGGWVNRKATKIPGIKKGYDKNVRRMSINIRMAEKGQRVRKR